MHHRELPSSLPFPEDAWRFAITARRTTYAENAKRNGDSVAITAIARLYGASYLVRESAPLTRSAAWRWYEAAGAKRLRDSSPPLPLG